MRIIFLRQNQIYPKKTTTKPTTFTTHGISDFQTNKSTQSQYNQSNSNRNITSMDNKETVGCKILQTVNNYTINMIDNKIRTTSLVNCINTLLNNFIETYNQEDNVQNSK